MNIPDISSALAKLKFSLCYSSFTPNPLDYINPYSVGMDAYGFGLSSYIRTNIDFFYQQHNIFTDENVLYSKDNDESNLIKIQKF